MQELDHGMAAWEAPLAAFQAAMIPVINSLSAVGLGIATGNDDRSGCLACRH
jgi:hypothetical protein